MACLACLARYGLDAEGHTNRGLEEEESGKQVEATPRVLKDLLRRPRS